MDTYVSEWVNIIRPHITSEGNPAFRLKMLKVFFEVSNNMDDWGPVLLEVLNDMDEAIRLTAATMASRYGPQIPRHVLDKLKEMLMDVSIEVRQAAARTLIRIGGFREEDIVPLLEHGFGYLPKLTESWEYGALLADLLSLTKKASRPDVVGKIAGRLNQLLESEMAVDDGDSIAWYPFLAHRRIRPRVELAESVSRLFTSHDPVIRRRAANTWAFIRPKSTPPTPLLPLLRDSDPRVRSAAHKALHSNDLQQSEIFDMVFCSVTEENSEIAKAASSVLSSIQEPNLRQRVIDQAAGFLVQAPGNKHIFEVLWNLLASPRTRRFEVL